MKKIIIIFVVALLSVMSQAFSDDHLIQKKNVQESQEHCFFDAHQVGDEYADNGDNQTDIDEYDYHVCDDVKPPKISNAQIFLTNIAGKLLVHYLIIKQTASIYFQELKDLLNNWFKSMVRQ